VAAAWRVSHFLRFATEELVRAGVLRLGTPLPRARLIRFYK
jgi:hypothetical protein